MSKQRRIAGRANKGLSCGRMMLIFLLVVILALTAAVIAGYALGVFDSFLEYGIETPFPAILPIRNTDTPTTGGAVPTTDLNVTLLPGTTPTATPETFSPTASPTPTGVLATPTSTPTQPPTAPPDICAQFDLRFHRVTSNIIAWRLQNNTGQDFVLEQVEINWPTSNDALFNIFLDGTMIWGGEDLIPPSFAATWIGERTDRVVDGLSRLEFFFGAEAAESGYNLTLQFENGCEASLSR